VSTVLVFAYGSNVCVQRIRARTPSAEVVAVASLAGHRLAFHKRSRDGSAKVDAVVCGTHDVRLWGVVYELSRRDKKILDGFEGLGRDYFERIVEVEAVDGALHRAWIYTANPVHIDATVLPWSWYKRFVLEGALQHGFPRDYVAAIERVEALDDPDHARHEAELSVLVRRRG